MKRSPGRFAYYALLLIGACVFAYAVGWFGFDLQSCPVVGAPVAAWLFCAPQTRQYFRHPWFWWTSAAFLIVSVIAVSWLHLLPSGSSLGQWGVITIVEALLFLAAVVFGHPDTPEGHARSRD